MADISFISLLNTLVAFLTTTFSAPLWLFLLLFITSVPQFLKIYRSFKNSNKTEQVVKKIQMPARNISNSITGNKFTESMVTTVNKLKNVAHSAGEAASDGIAAAAKKFETEMNAKTASPAPKTEEMGKEQIKTVILKKLFKVGDNGRLPQSISSDLSMSKIVTNEYLDELTETNLIAKRKTSLGETYFITKMGKEFCASQGFEK